ncbi:MAG: amidohydrolase family protein [Pseudonocardia sp.]
MRTVIRAARLFDGATCTDDPLVLIEDGRVAAVEHGPLPPWPGADLLELSGATLLPGLVDTHVHLGFDASSDAVAALAARDDATLLDAMAGAAAAQLHAGVTTVRDLGDRDYAALDLRDSGRGPLPTIVAAGPPITSPGGHCHFLGGAASGVAGVRAAVRAHAERGVDVIKVMASGGLLTAGTDIAAPQFGAAELRTVVTEAHRHGLPVTAHAHATAAIADAIAAGVDGVEHCSFAGSTRAPDDLVDALVRRRIVVGATLGLAPSEVLASPPPELARLLPIILAAYRRLVAAGAVVVAGTDAGIAPPKPHGVLPHGLVELVALGMPPLDALRAGTAVAAQVCGVGDRKGRVTPGYDADLLAVRGDPTTDIGALLAPVAVLLAGELVATPAVAR